MEWKVEEENKVKLSVGAAKNYSCGEMNEVEGVRHVLELLMKRSDRREQ